MHVFLKEMQRGNIWTDALESYVCVFESQGKQGSLVKSKLLCSVEDYR